MLNNMSSKEVKQYYQNQFFKDAAAVTFEIENIVWSRYNGKFDECAEDMYKFVDKKYHLSSDKKKRTFINNIKQTKQYATEHDYLKACEESGIEPTRAAKCKLCIETMLKNQGWAGFHILCGRRGY